jgi:putative phage-type endonuclease
MSMYYECQQYPEWWEARRGIATASCADSIVTPATGKLSASAKPYACELLAQRLTPGQYWLEQMDIQSTAMANGAALEPEARAYAALQRGVEVHEVGFVTTDCGRFGCSPDGIYTGQKRGLEIKCPLMKTHIGYILEGTLPAKYKPQVHFSMVVAGAEAWDFLSYCHGLPPLFITVEPDAYTLAVKSAMESFGELYESIAKKIGVTL